jgi:hypothetical protein
MVCSRAVTSDHIAVTVAVRCARLSNPPVDAPECLPGAGAHRPRMMGTVGHADRSAATRSGQFCWGESWPAHRHRREMAGRVAVGTAALVRDRCRGRMALDDGEARKGTCLTGPVGFAGPIGRCQTNALGRQASPSTGGRPPGHRRKKLRRASARLPKGPAGGVCCSSDPARDALGVAGVADEGLAC